MTSDLSVLTTKNFGSPSIVTYSEDDFRKICNTRTTVYDKRLDILSIDTDPSNMNWYINYLQTTSYIAKHNPDAYSNYLLDLGYIPIVYLPLCFQELSASLLNTLNAREIPYVQIRTTSFSRAYVASDAYDAWISKMDLQRIFDMDPRTVTSVEAFRRIYGS